MSRSVEFGGVAPRRWPLLLDDELVLAGLAIVAITMLYLGAVALAGVPAASGLFGHSLGIIGFGLMVATETMYSWRKRSRGRGWGRMSVWLKFHIFTGIVGPYLVFLHTAWKLHGLAGLALLMTAVVVVSGFFGRYIYTAVPRTADGAVLERAEIERRLASAEAELKRVGAPPLPSRPVVDSGLAAGTALVLGRSLLGWGESLREWNRRRRLSPAARAAQARVDALVRRRSELQRQIGTLAAARRLMGAWHTLHVPLGMIMFSMVILHIGAALYYATLLK